MSVIEGRQSSSFLGMMWTSRSLPSAMDGVQNYPVYTRSVSYLCSRHYERWLEGELVSKKYLEVEAINALVEPLRPYYRAPLNFNLYDYKASEVT